MITWITGESGCGKSTLAKKTRRNNGRKRCNNQKRTRYNHG